MSASTPANSSGDGGCLQSAADRVARPWWFWLSILLHLGVLLAVVFLSPVRKIILPKKNAAQRVSATAAQIEKIAKLIGDKQLEELRADAGELAAVQRQVAEGARRSEEKYQEFTKVLAATAPEDALAAARVAVAALEKATAPQAQTVAELNRAEAFEAAAQQDQSKTAKSQASQTGAAAELALMEAIEAQLKADTALEFAAPALAAAREAQKKVTALSQQAAKLQSEAAALNSESLDLEQQSSQLLNRSRITAQRDAQMKQQTGRLENTLRSAENQVAELSQQLARQTAALPPTHDKQAKNSENRQLQNLENRIRQAQKKVTGSEQTLRSAERKQAEASKLPESEQTALETQQKKIHELTSKAAAAQQQAVAAHQAALQGQRKLVTDIAAANANAPVAEPVEPAAAASAETAAAPTARVQGDNLAELYQSARAIERETTESFRDQRAWDLAVLQKTTLGRARAATEIAAPQRPELPGDALTMKPRTPGELEQFQEAVRVAKQEMEAMLTLAHTMAGSVAASTADERDGVSVDLAASAAQSAAAHANMVALAAEDSGARAKDLSAEMRAATEGGGVEYGADVPATPRVQSATRSTASEAPKIDPTKTMAGRRVGLAGSGAVDAEWLFVDTWWVIGPFPNPARANIDRKFPPDSVIDLDATYQGRAGGLVRWKQTLWQPLQFQYLTNPPKNKKAQVPRFPDISPVSPSQPGVNQEYAIYYAYTELWFETATDAWIAVGSDDNSRLTINNQPVWISGRQLKSWRADEGYRKVYFKQGLNQVLYRIENGHGPCAWSLMIHTGASGG